MSEARTPRILRALAARGVPALLRLACGLGLVALMVMVLPLLFPSALTLVGSMAIGHGLGLIAAGLFLLAIFLDVAQRRGS